jgi:CubicO group peptidase (beta-lactamase class C family)
MDAERISREFQDNFARRGELGASVSIWQDGREIVNLGGGFCDREQTRPWTAETSVLVWSATKGPAAGCLLHACQEHRVALSTRVATLWPEFAAGGKDQVTIAEVMSHQAGLAGLAREVPVLDYPGVIAALAAQTPLWPRGAGHGYHPRTLGYLFDELVRRVTGGVTLREYWRQVFGFPLELHLWIGMDTDDFREVSPVYAPRTAPQKGDPFYAAFLTAGSATSRAFASPKGFHTAGAMNSPEARRASLPAFGGIGTAHALAKYYAMLANGGFLDGRTFFTPETLALMTTPLTQGPDKVLLTESAFSAGFMKDPVGPDGRKIRMLFGPSTQAFGQPGAGGSHAFADPENRRAFAYVMNQMEPGVLPGEKSLRLVRAMTDASD